VCALFFAGRHDFKTDLNLEKGKGLSVQSWSIFFRKAFIQTPVHGYYSQIQTSYSVINICLVSVASNYLINVVRQTSHGI